jgi:hypothetical protein
MSEYPECEKVENVSEISNVIGEFLDWLRYTKKVQLMVFHKHTGACYELHDCELDPRNCRDENGKELHPWTSPEARKERCKKPKPKRICGFSERPGRSYHGLEPLRTGMEELLAEYFNIDLRKVEREKKAMLEALRKPRDDLKDIYAKEEEKA